MNVKLRYFLVILAVVVLISKPALASEAAQASHSYHFNGTKLANWWVLPFAGMLISIALGPLCFPHFWKHHFGKTALIWALLFLIPSTLIFGRTVTTYAVVETLLLEYLPFVILLLALFTITGGIHLTGTLVGTPHLNTLLLLIGTFIASLVGTTGSAMLLIRPILRANAHRRYRVHTIIFFIFLVANIGGSLTPLGDPPLFLGFLKGVSFFWTVTHLFTKTIFMATTLLLIYILIDIILYNREGRPKLTLDSSHKPFGFTGSINFPLLAGVVLMVLISGLWRSGIKIHVWADIFLDFQNLTRDTVLLGLTGLSLVLTKPEVRRSNNFTWGPILEVAKLFAGIFITMIPAIAILRAGSEGNLRNLVALATSFNGQPLNYTYFWLTGILSSFLDNAPTYLVFFNMAGGEAKTLMTTLPDTLTAISAGAVFMGANTYIGNAPNFMVRAIAEGQGVKMPSFFGYMVWSLGILIPLFVIITFIFFT
ncbi:MAG: sodium:proton antiporter [Candidatus Adiutrix intracellularis]|jgi:Na+/H+ antiporter NhaD/arsenite permease-like protein|nr:sodium:proton antiporter [Candidatus Adiutrix intracellularis]